MNPLAISLSNDFLDLTPKNSGNKRKNKQVELYQTKKLLHSKENHQQKEKQLIEEIISKPHLIKLNIQNIQGTTQ